MIEVLLLIFFIVFCCVYSTRRRHVDIRRAWRLNILSDVENVMSEEDRIKCINKQLSFMTIEAGADGVLSFKKILENSKGKPEDSTHSESSWLPKSWKAASRLFGDTQLSPEECAICLGEYEAGDTIAWAKAEGCDHVFHGECIREWLKKQHDECPLCRKEILITTKDLICREIDDGEESDVEIGPPLSTPNTAATSSSTIATTPQERETETSNPAPQQAPTDVAFQRIAADTVVQRIEL